MAARFDVILERGPDFPAAECADLNAGTKVELRYIEGVREVLTEAGVVLGCVPSNRVLSGGTFSGHVRTIKRDPESKAITEIAVRFVRGEKTIQPEGKDLHRRCTRSRPQTLINTLAPAQSIYHQT
jgi:hypothetical protein